MSSAVPLSKKDTAKLESSKDEFCTHLWYGIPSRVETYHQSFVVSYSIRWWIGYYYQLHKDV